MTEDYTYKQQLLFAGILHDNNVEMLVLKKNDTVRFCCVDDMTNNMLLEKYVHGLDHIMVEGVDILTTVNSIDKERLENVCNYINMGRHLDEFKTIILRG